MEVLSCIWSSGGGGGLKTSMPYVLLTRPFSFLNSTFLNSSRALARLGGGLTEVCMTVDGSIIGHAAAAQEDAASGVEQSAGAESQGHDGASSQVPIGTVVKSSGSHLAETMMDAGRVHCDPGAVLSSAVPVASTSGRVDPGFWNERRKRHSCSVTQSPGMLFVVDNDRDRFPFIELEQGKLEENIVIGEGHSVSTCFEQGDVGDSKSIWLSTSHKLDVNHMLATHYADDLKGGADFTLNTSHNFVPASRLSTCFHAESLGDPTLEVELEQDREARKVLESVVTNLRTGDCVLRLQSKKILKHNVALTNSYVTNLRGQHSLRLETTTPLQGSGNISSSFSTNFQGTQELCVKGSQWIGERNVVGASYVTDLNQGNHVSLEAKHSVKGIAEMTLKLTNDLHGALQLCVTSSHTRECTHWGWTYRNGSSEEQCLGLEWRHEVSPEKYFAVQASTKNWRWKLCADMHMPSGTAPKFRTLSL
ncbi:unnamed protein product [Sphagnum jensenii]|uniref:Uncharacterized protein n=1 Tax=Sphagnum jensenii TaxID=128206 RepID=A0ABP0WYJ5_9BRYO